MTGKKITYRCPTCGKTISVTVRLLELPLCIADHPEGCRGTLSRLMMPDAPTSEATS